MFFYEVVLLKSPLKPLTYQSIEDIKIGTLVDVNLKRRKNLIQGVIIKKVNKPSFICSDIVSVLKRYYSLQMISTAKFISTYYICSLGEALSVYIPFYDIQKSTNEKYIKSDIVLSEDQKGGLKFIQEHNTSLLFAATGSGKTEIYIKAIEDIIVEDKQALMLIPEISLSAQMEKRLKLIFGEKIAIWHSKITKKSKNQIIDNLLNGTVQIIAGARSALFLPYNNLGIIIVDEEHDDSYKSDQKPRLNVKDLAIYIGSKQNIKVVLGSATPSLSSFYKIPYFRIKKTYFDSKKNISYDESDLSISDVMLEKISNTIKNNKQVIVFLPTRANFKYQICDDCGKSVECPFCSVSLSLHKKNNALQCHYCNYTQAIPKFCPSCKVGLIKNFRLGTAEVYDRLSSIFKDKIVSKFDRDSITTESKLKKTLKNFNDKKIDILVGTQMLSKGHDYHNVTLAVVLGIDSILNMTSYKVREKALSLLIQIAGRSGRKGDGEVLIQTKNKDFFNHYLSCSDYEDFLNSELKQRENLYPPFLRLARVIFSHKNANLAKRDLGFYVENFKKENGVEIIGFGESNIFKIANRYRYELLLKSHDTKKLITVLHKIDTPTASIDMDSLY
ncbi:MAG: primosomal protein N' [Campylobacterota bacterium]|nr:primosomal protein N' [Campylobacterota bacterium]